MISGKWRRQVLGLQAPRKWVRDVSANFLLTSKLAESSTVPYPFWFAGASRVRVLGVSTEGHPEMGVTGKEGCRDPQKGLEPKARKEMGTRVQKGRLELRDGLEQTRSPRPSHRYSGLVKPRKGTVCRPSSSQGLASEGTRAAGQIPLHGAGLCRYS